MGVKTQSATCKLDIWKFVIVIFLVWNLKQVSGIQWRYMGSGRPVFKLCTNLYLFSWFGFFFKVKMAESSQNRGKYYIVNKIIIIIIDTHWHRMLPRARQYMTTALITAAAPRDCQIPKLCVGSFSSSSSRESTFCKSYEENELTLHFSLLYLNMKDLTRGLPPFFI